MKREGARPRFPRLAAAGFAAFLATAVLVQAGALAFVDRYAARHWMPWFEPRHQAVTLGSVTVLQPRGPALAKLLEVWIYPASVVVSAVIVVLAAWALRRRGETRAALTWCALWVAANAIELLGKELVSRPALYVDGVRAHGFAHSLPSGHTLRSLVVAAAIAYTWPRIAPYALAWAVTTLVVLVPLGWHTPTDIAAGVFAAAFLAGWMPAPSRTRG
ncbi:MAG TPA: phosphatase PAP2 family protein [Gaiellaceae bacterium]|nr:phosphatase PAP2 family protein [Gaiellaceae bacterium]